MLLIYLTSSLAVPFGYHKFVCFLCLRVYFCFVRNSAYTILWDSTCKWHHMIYLSLTSFLSMITSRSIHIATNGTFSLFLVAEWWSNEILKGFYGSFQLLPLQKQFSGLKGHHSPLEGVAGLHPQTWWSRGPLEQSRLHFHQVPRWCCSWFWGHTLRTSILSQRMGSQNPHQLCSVNKNWVSRAWLKSAAWCALLRLRYMVCALGE